MSLTPRKFHSHVESALLTNSHVCLQRYEISETQTHSIIENNRILKMLQALQKGSLFCYINSKQNRMCVSKVIWIRYYKTVVLGLLFCILKKRNSLFDHLFVCLLEPFFFENTWYQVKINIEYSGLQSPGAVKKSIFFHIF